MQCILNRVFGGRNSSNMNNDGSLIDKIKALVIKYREIITYLIAGVLTTLVNLAATYLLHDLCGLNEDMYIIGGSGSGLAFDGAQLTTAIAWAVAVAFAYWINNGWVFRAGNEGGAKEAAKIGKFVLARLFTFVVEWLGVLIFITNMGCNFWLVKIILMVIVTVLNYVFSKLLIFIAKDNKADDLHCD